MSRQPAPGLAAAVPWAAHPGGRRPLPPSAVRFVGCSFDERAAEPPPEATFTAAELEAARQVAFAAGHAAGLAESSASRAAAEAAGVAAVADALGIAAVEAGRVADEAASALARAVLAAMRAVMPALVERGALAEAETMLHALLPGLSREPRVEVVVPAALAPGIGAVLDRLGASDRARVEVFASPGAHPGAVEVRWSSGHAVRQPRQVLETVMSSLEAALDATNTTEDGR